MQFFKNSVFFTLSTLCQIYKKKQYLLRRFYIIYIYRDKKYNYAFLGKENIYN